MLSSCLTALAVAVLASLGAGAIGFVLRPNPEFSR